jgi:hypothetical protein
MTEHVFTLAQMRAAIKAVEAGGHSVFSPSGSKMWLGCAGSLIPNLFAPDDAGEDAAYGSVGHMVGEVWLKTGKKPKHLLGQTWWVPAGDFGFFITIDEVMMDYVKRYVDWCKHLPGDHYVETRVDISPIMPIPNQRGTADHCACEYQRMVITDLKLGKGVRVHAENNTQALLYALGFFYAWDWLYDFREIVIRIAQPRLDVFEDWTVTREELLDFAEYAKVRAAAAWVQNAPRTPSDEACQWCRVQATCGPRMKVLFDASEGVFTSIGREIEVDEVDEFREKLKSDWQFTPMTPHDLSTEDLERIYQMHTSVKRLWEKVGEELFRRAQGGIGLKQWKMVEGRSFRAFRNKEKAGAKLIELGCKREAVFVTELVSPAVAEELLQKAGHSSKDIPALLRGMVFKPPGKATLAAISDRRPAIGDKSEGVFTDTTLTMEI